MWTGVNENLSDSISNRPALFVQPHTDSFSELSCENRACAHLPVLALSRGTSPEANAGGEGD